MTKKKTSVAGIDAVATKTSRDKKISALDSEANAVVTKTSRDPRYVWPPAKKLTMLEIIQQVRITGKKPDTDVSSQEFVVIVNAIAAKN